MSSINTRVPKQKASLSWMPEPHPGDPALPSSISGSARTYGHSYLPNDGRVRNWKQGCQENQTAAKPGDVNSWIHITTSTRTPLCPTLAVLISSGVCVIFTYPKGQKDKRGSRNEKDQLSDAKEIPCTHSLHLLWCSKKLRTPYTLAFVSQTQKFMKKPKLSNLEHYPKLLSLQELFTSVGHKQAGKRDRTYQPQVTNKMHIAVFSAGK